MSAGAAYVGSNIWTPGRAAGASRTLGLNGIPPGSSKRGKSGCGAGIHFHTLLQERRRTGTWDSLGETDIAVENAAVDRPVDEFRFECQKRVRQSRLKCPKGHFSLSRVIEFERRASPTLKCQSTASASDRGHGWMRFCSIGYVVSIRISPFRAVALRMPCVE